MTLDTGTSGVEANFVVVMPFLMSVLPTRITRTPLASSTRSRSGNAAPPWETRIAGPCSLPGSVGVFALAPPTIRAARAAVRVGLERRCRARFLQRRQPRRQLLGQLHEHRLDVRLAGRLVDRRFEARAVGFRGLRAVLAALNVGLNASALQLSTWNGRRQALRSRRAWSRERGFGREQRAVGRVEQEALAC